MTSAPGASERSRSKKGRINPDSLRTGTMIETIGLLIFSILHSNWRFMIARHFSIAFSRSQSRYVNASP